MTSISIARAKSHFHEPVGRAAAGERIVIGRRDRAVAALISVAEPEQLEQRSRVARQSARALGQRAEVGRYLV